MSDWIEKIHAHADGEQVDAAEVQRLLDTEPRAAAEHQWAVYLRTTLRERHVKPDHSQAWAKAKERLDAIDALEGDSRVGSFVGRYSWAFAAGLFVVILFAGILNWGSKAPLNSRELAGIFTSPPLTQEMQSPGPGGADAFAAQNNFEDAPRVEPVVRVVNAGYGVHEGTEFIKYDLADNSGPLTMFMFRPVSQFEDFDPLPGRSDYYGAVVNGRTAVGWIEGDTAYLLMCERSSDELVTIADRIRQRH